MKYLAFYFLLQSIFILELKAQSNVKEVVSSLDNHLVDIDIHSRQNDFGDLSFLDQHFEGKKIIALGEGTHGTKDIFLFKDRLIRYLVTNHNAKYILIESDMAGLEKLNDYVMSEQLAKLKDVMSGSGIFGIYYTQEVADMIEWLKKYNLDKPLHSKVKFKGMDMQSTRYIFPKILNNEVFMKNLSENSKDYLTTYNKDIDNEIVSFSKDQLKDLKDVSKELKSILKTVGREEKLELDVQLYDQIISLQNVHPYMYSFLRDKFMAANVAFIAMHSLPEEKLVVWAHNGHISNHLLIKHKAMGMRLKNQFGDKYYSLALGVADGYSRLYDIADPKKVFKPTKLPKVLDSNSVEYIFKMAKAENFFLQISGSRFNDSFEDFINKPRKMVAIGPIISPNPVQNYNQVILKKAYNGFVFLRNTVAASDMN